jgi:enolase
MSRIEKIVAREVLDSRGNPTVEVDVMSNRALWEELLFRRSFYGRK